MPVQRETTIYDIARELNLSPSTVSRGLRNHPAIKEETVERIHEAALAMNYQQNTFASKLRSNRSNTIGIVVPRLESAFLGSVVTSIEREIRSRGYHLHVSQSFDSLEQEKQILDVLYNSRVEGLLINLSPETKGLEHLEMFHKKNIPVVLFDRVEQSPTCSCTSISINNYQAGYDVTRHLIDEGCKRIAYVTLNMNCMVFGERGRGYLDAIRDAGLEHHPEMVLEEQMNMDTGALVVDKLLALNPRPDGVFAGIDMSAASLMHELKSRGVGIPEDMAIAGFNNSDLSRMIEPQLTTVHYPTKEMGRMAAKSLMEMLDTRSQVAAQNIVLKHELKIRPSSLRKRH